MRRTELTRRPEVMDIDFTEELRRSYLEYSLSVILSRALPDVRDGLKPVQRRILWAMYEMGLHPNRPFKKCASIVGEVLGRYHPHGDSAVYEALVRMAQDFSMRYPLIEGQGNFGSLDGDPPAAYRYTEARLSRVAMEMLRDVELDTVDFRPNFDNTRREPVVLPSAFPNLLVNGSLGIAVGMSTSIPPHNLRNVADAIKLYIENPKVSDTQLIKAIVGPDFPTGGVIVGTRQLFKAYRTGRGLITLEGKYEVQEHRGKTYLVITEIPYGVNKAKLVESIAKGVKDRKIVGVADLVDSSDREGVRIMLELRPGVDPEGVVNQLRKHTDFRTSMLIQLVAVNGHRPRLYTLRELIEEYVRHRREVIRRRTSKRLEMAEDRAHVLEGLIKLVDALDLAIELIRSSESPAEAKAKLMEELDLSDRQAEHILAMQLQQLTRTQREELLKELESLRTEIASLRRLLDNPKLVDSVIVEELEDLVRRFDSPRRTTFYDKDPYKEVKVKESVEEVTFWIAHDGYYALSKNSKGLPSASSEPLISASAKTVDYLALLTSSGQYFWIQLRRLSETASRAEFLGRQVSLASGERIVGVILAPKRSPKRYLKGKEVLVVTNLGRVKKLSPDELLENLGSSRRSRYIKLDEGERVLSVMIVEPSHQLVMLSSSAYVMRIDDVPVYGRSAKGVIGMRLKEGEELFRAWPVSPDEVQDMSLALLSADWNLYVLSLSEVPLARRGTRGRKLGLELRDAWLFKAPASLTLEMMDRTQREYPLDELLSVAKVSDGLKVISLRKLDVPVNLALKVRLRSG